VACFTNDEGGVFARSKSSILLGNDHVVVRRLLPPQKCYVYCCPSWFSLL